MRKQRAPKSPTQKRSFLLFELLISLALIVLCLFPLIKLHAVIRKEQRKQLEEMQMERIAQEAFCKLKIKLYENQHTWKELMSNTQGEQGSFEITTGAEAKKTVTCTYTIKEAEHSPKPSLRATGLVIKIDLDFDLMEKKHHFQRTLFLEQRELS